MRDSKLAQPPPGEAERAVPGTGIAGGHEVLPVKDSAYSVYGTKPASLLNPYDYPVVAVCAGCGRRVRAETLYSSWEHPGEPGERLMSRARFMRTV